MMLDCLSGHTGSTPVRPASVGASVVAAQQVVTLLARVRFPASPQRKREMAQDDLIYRLRKRAEIRRQIPLAFDTLYAEGQPDRIADLLDEAAQRIEELQEYEFMYKGLQK